MFVTFTSDNDTNGDGFVADYVIDDGLAEAVGARAMAEQIAELKASEKKKDNEIADLEASDQKKGKEITVIEEGIASLIKAVRENKALSTGATKAIEASQKHIAAHISDTAIRIQKNTHAAAAAQTGAAAAAATAESNLKRVQDNEIAVKANAKASAANKLKAEAQEKKRLVDAEEAEKKKIAAAAKAAAEAKASEEKEKSDQAAKEEAEKKQIAAAAKAAEEKVKKDKIQWVLGDNMEVYMDAKGIANGIHKKPGNYRGYGWSSAPRAWNGKATSVAEFSCTNGDCPTYRGVEFSPKQEGMYFRLGLSGKSRATGTHVDFAWYLTSINSLEVIERGFIVKYVSGANSFHAGDKFSVTVNSGGKVEYRHNNVVKYTSTRTPTFPLGIDTSFFSNDCTAMDVKWVDNK